VTDEERAARWRQIAGDVTWESHGVVLARNNPAARQVHLVRIDPWMEHDREAAVSHGLYLVDAVTFDHDDLGLDRPDVRGAIAYVGVNAAEYETLDPEHRAEILASYAGYEESSSVDRLIDALPVAPGEIAFWGGTETEEKLASYDADMRREALAANFDTRLTFGELPPHEALAFALGAEPLTLELQGQDAIAFEYAVMAAGVPGRTDSAEDVAATVRALAGAPPPADQDSEAMDPRLERILTAWEGRYGDPMDEENGITAVAASLASSMMSAIGFEWI
jgi:hypothetical protein